MKRQIALIIMMIISVILLNACSAQMCDICGEKRATKTYENMLGMKMHVCGDCYKDVKELSSYVN